MSSMNRRDENEAPVDVARERPRDSLGIRAERTKEHLTMGCFFISGRSVIFTPF